MTGSRDGKEDLGMGEEDEAVWVRGVVHRSHGAERRKRGRREDRSD